MRLFYVIILLLATVGELQTKIKEDRIGSVNLKFLESATSSSDTETAKRGKSLKVRSGISVHRSDTDAVTTTEASPVSEKHGRIHRSGHFGSGGHSHFETKT